jgi:hypothetical protein
MQLIRDNLTLWTSELAEDDDDDDEWSRHINSPLLIGWLKVNKTFTHYIRL